MQPSMTPAKATVTRITEEQATGPDGKLQNFVRVQFNVGTHGPFSERIPKDQFNPAMVQQKIDQFAQHVAQVAGL